MRLKKYSEKFIELSILVFIMALPVIFFTKTNDVFEINKMYTFRFFTIAVFCVWLVNVVYFRTLKLAKTDFDFPLIGLLAVSVLTTVITENFTVSFFGVYEDFEGILTVMNYFVLFYIIINYAANEKMKGKMLLAILITTLIVSLYGLAQNFGIDFIRWNPETYNPGRFFSTLGNPNFLAAYLVETIPIIFIMFFLATGRFKKISILMVLFLAIVILFLTKSRAGFASFMLTITFIFIYTWYDSKRSTGGIWKTNKVWFIAFVLMFIVTLIISPKVQDAFISVFKRISLVFTGFTKTPRLYIWQSALMMFKDNPLLGKGLDTFQVIFPYYRLPEYWRLEWNGTPEKTHNVFFQVLATQGMAGFSFYALLIIVFLKKSFNTVVGQADMTKRYISFAFFMAVIAYFIQGMFNYTVLAYGSTFWISMAMISNSENKQRRFLELNIPERSFLGTGRKIIIFSVVLLGALLMVSLSRYWVADMYYKIGNIGVNSGKENLALPYYKKSVELNPYREIYWVKYGIGFEKAARREQDPQLKKKFLEEAILIHMHTLKLNDKNGYNYNNVARTYKTYGEILDRNKFNDAEKYYDEAIKRDPNNAYFGLDLATVYISQGKYIEAEAICNRYISLYPDFATPYTYIGYMNMLQGQQKAATDPKATGEHIEKAKIYYEKALDGKQWFRDDMSMQSTYSNLGIIYYNIGRIDKAIEKFEEIIARTPQYREGYLNLAMIYTKAGNTEKAIETYERLLKFAPDDQRALRPLEELNKRRKR